MTKNIIFAMMLASLLAPIALHASQEAQNLGVCLTDSLSGKERKNLAKWIYFGMSSHSTIRPYSNIPQNDVNNLNKYVGHLVTRLLTEDCPKSARAAFERGGSLAFERAFKVVGEVAMQELMNEPNVSQSLGAFEQYFDHEKVNEVLE